MKSKVLQADMTLRETGAETITADTGLWIRLTKREKRNCILFALAVFPIVWACIALAGVLGQ